MVWKIEYLKSARNDVKKIDHQARRRIRDYLEKRVATLDNPRQLGKALNGQMAELWRYRIGDYRVICDLRDDSLVVLVLRIRHRSQAFRLKS